MAVPVRATAPLVKGKYGVFISGFPLGYFESAKIPAVKVKKTSVQPAGASAPVKFPSGLAEDVDDAEFEYYQGADGLIDAAVAAWLRQCVAFEGVTVPPEEAKRDVSVIQYDASDNEVHEWTLIGCFVVDPGPIELESGAADAVKRKLLLSVDWVEQTR